MGMESPSAQAAFRGCPIKTERSRSATKRPSLQRRGLGTAAVSALVEQARRSGAVGTAIARTATELNPSVRILKQLGFSNTGLAKAPDSDDDVWQWQLDV